MFFSVFQSCFLDKNMINTDNMVYLYQLIIERCSYGF